MSAPASALRIVAAIWALTASVAAIACDEAPSDGAGCATLSVVEGQHGTIEFEGTPGTGARWRFDAGTSTNADIIEVTDLGYGEPDSPRIGGPAPYRFDLLGLSPGTAALVFVYGRAWEAEAWETRVLRVEVTAASSD